MSRLYSPQLDVILTEISIQTDGRRGRDVRSCGYVDEADPWVEQRKQDSGEPLAREDFRRVLWADAVSRDDDPRPVRKLTGARFFVDELVVLIP